uniref:Venom peptide HtC2Tx2 n=1 Tax=Hadogenes troglodytes TaxID=1577150 RepID=A0A1B3IIZ2_9SCOR|nr:venom peptide HtC2Tx2 [Hadogenes troglodytes]
MRGFFLIALILTVQLISCFGARISDEEMAETSYRASEDSAPMDESIRKSIEKRCTIGRCPGFGLLHG